jgi:hypothetical protein
MTDTMAGVQVRSDLTETEAMHWFKRTGMTPTEIIKALAAQPSAGARGEAVARLNEVCAQMDIRLPVAFSVEQQTQHAADIRTVLAARVTPTAAQPDTGAVDWSHYEDDLSDAISDSFGPDWTARDGAKAVIGWLTENSRAIVSLDEKSVRRVLWRMSFKDQPAFDNPGDEKWRLAASATRLIAAALSSKDAAQ